MTYCVAMRLDAGLVFLSDSRTNAGVDAISTFRKMTVFEREGDRVMVLLTAGNLAISQAVRQVLTEARGKPRSLWTARDMFEAATIVGEAVRDVFDLDVQRRRVEQIESPSRQHPLPGTRGLLRGRMFRRHLVLRARLGLPQVAWQWQVTMWSLTMPVACMKA